MARAARLLPALAALLAAAATGDARPSKIAVVGAGIGGSAVAHFLQQHFGPRVQIDVFEKGTVGGRLATISVNKQHYESGAASLHSLSLHMQDFVKQLGLRHRREVGGRSAIFNGESLVLEETDWYLLNLFRLWWHYGISFLRLQLWVEEVMEKFMRRAGPPQPVTRPEAHNQPPLPPREARPQVGAERPLHKGPGSVCLQDLQVPGPRLRLLGRGGAALLPGGGRLHQHEPALRGRVPAPGGRQPALHRRRRLGRPAGQLRPVGSDARLCRGFPEDSVSRLLTNPHDGTITPSRALSLPPTPPKKGMQTCVINKRLPHAQGAMSLAGAQGSLWSVEGGNKLVCSGLLKLTKANVIHATVTSVNLQQTDGKPLYQVWYENEAGVGSDYYDIVVIATPLHPDSGSSITFGGFDPPIAVAQGPFQPAVVSLVHGYLNSSYFGFPDPKLFPFATILTTDFPSFFLALDNLCPVNVSASFRRRQPQEAAVWRVRSPQPLLRSQLKTLFRSYYSVQTAEWQAHPVHGPHGPLPRFVLHDQLFHLNALEWAASSVEVTAVAAKNVALLAFNRWYQDLDKIDQKDLMHKVKTEL
ncbi:prenylcysteine oxidase-like isoform X2 [Phacochoerus africanus]|uniref:prenylcysteine oxidase-like isoform X2 n=1 Tax=Phacochoerus africanus TaxID=41426 RepID=UPI001FDAB3AF|nr:prenylcysteine oxidase-like isoform X2 [Phacochoerus africanus]